MTNALVIKIGGAILERDGALQRFMEIVAQLKVSDPQKAIVVVHGGGVIVDAMLQQAGYVSEKRNGARVTPFEQMPTISGALSGYVNKAVVSIATQVGLNPVGLSLVDGTLATCEMNREGLGAVGIPKANQKQLLEVLLQAGFLPIISSIGMVETGELVNLNADDAAVVVSELLDAELLLLTDVDGVLGADGQLLSSLTHLDAQHLIASGVISGGMTAKIQAAFYAANQLRRSIAVASWESPEQIVNLLSGQAIGTRIIPNQAGSN